MRFFSWYKIYSFDILSCAICLYIISIWPVCVIKCNTLKEEETYRIKNNFTITLEKRTHNIANNIK